MESNLMIGHMTPSGVAPRARRSTLTFLPSMATGPFCGGLLKGIGKDEAGMGGEEAGGKAEGGEKEKGEERTPRESSSGKKKKSEKGLVHPVSFFISFLPEERSYFLLA